MNYDNFIARSQELKEFEIEQENKNIQLQTKIVIAQEKKEND